MRISLFFKIFGLSLAVLGVSLGLGTLLLERSMLFETSRQIESDNILLVRELSRALALPLLKNDRLAIEDNIGVFEDTKGVLDIRVYDRNGNLAEDLSTHHAHGADPPLAEGMGRGVRWPCPRVSRGEDGGGIRFLTGQLCLTPLRIVWVV